MTAADNTCEHGWTWGQCCPKPWPPCCEPSCTPIPEQKSCFLHGDHDEERCPRCARLPRVCSHGIYHHGCPSCDRQDPEVSP